VALGTGVLAEVVGDLVAEGQHTQELPGPPVRRPGRGPRRSGAAPRASHRPWSPRQGRLGQGPHGGLKQAVGSSRPRRGYPGPPWARTSPAFAANSGRVGVGRHERAEKVGDLRIEPGQRGERPQRGAIFGAAVTEDARDGIRNSQGEHRFGGAGRRPTAPPAPHRPATGRPGATVVILPRLRRTARRPHSLGGLPSTYTRFPARALGKQAGSNDRQNR